MTDDRYRTSEDRVQALARELHDDELWRGVDLDMVREALDGWRALSPEERRRAFDEGVLGPPDTDWVDPSHWDREVARLRSLPRAVEDDGPELPFLNFDVENDPKAFIEKVRK